MYWCVCYLLATVQKPSNYRWHIKSTVLCFVVHCFLVMKLLRPWSRVLLEKLTGSKLLKTFPAFCGKLMFIIAFTRACHLSQFMLSVGWSNDSTTCIIGFTAVFASSGQLMWLKWWRYQQHNWLHSCTYLQWIFNVAEVVMVPTALSAAQLYLLIVDI